MTGTLGLFSLVDLFQLLSGSQRTGRLAVEHPAGLARVYFLDGRPVHAEFAELEGPEAVYALFADERGAFEFQVGLPAPRTSIEMGSENLMLEASRRIDEVRRDVATTRDPERVPEVANPDAPANLDLDAEERRLLDVIDGRRTLEDVARAAGTTVVEAGRVLARLEAAGAVRAHRRRARTARLVVRPGGDEVPVDAVGIDPSILEGWRRTTGESPERVACKRPDGRVAVFAVRAVSGAGPYLQLSRAGLLRTGLRADQPVLVRPVRPSGPGSA